eukprot:CAMPEP_0172474918 /NCGR_PEP_ID=MMETSP1065-20121228/69604_1 /TAXON_ID=265537 /ORGANISM="Amphiprora paludosa, Strain CCMP125" /LENGTH=659 /DNA_ID=CAMNT_0013233111 /DNA_START=154 /DNA_END=2133 /DNA_ORIENTATION=-
MSSARQSNTLMLVGGLAAAATVSLAMWYMTSSSSEKATAEAKAQKKTKSLENDQTTSRSINLDSRVETPPPQTPSSRGGAPPSQTTEEDEQHTPIVQNKNKTNKHAALNADERALHARIEELDKKGKALFKNKQFMEAAQTFTEALDLIGEYDDSVGTSSLSRQLITLMNNRSAMYEKANMPELALEDCSSILELEPNHTKARTRKLRILEALQRWYEALVEICAVQLLFMQANRTNIRMGLPTPPPPVPQSKMEQVLTHVVPEQVQKYSDLLLQEKGKRPLPSDYTILQLLKSYTGYNKWMAEAAKDGAVSSMTVPKDDDATLDDIAAADRATLLLKRGRRYVYDGQYALAMQDFETGYQLLQKYAASANLMENDSHARLLEWAGMGRHWQYQLDPAVECYEKAVNLEPNNALLLVKQAGVCMDGSLQNEAMVLFETALDIDPQCADALLHRSNLYMIQGKPEQAKSDLEKCVQLHPNHVMARLRLASILAATQDADNARLQLDAAERVEPNSSEVQSYRGELHFTQGEMEQARQQFEKAMKLEPNNPTPYVNAAMAILNTPPTAPGQMIDAQGAIALLEQALAVDPQFMAAYVQLGQLKLGTATELVAARKVIDLYDQALQNCRTTEDLKELCSMRVLAVAQVEAATMLKMESFNLQ